MVTLYHGTTVPFETPELSKSRRGMDFGSGFYATPNRALSFLGKGAVVS